MTIQPNTFRAGPDERGFFGIYGGRFVAETLMPLILELEAAYDAAKKDPAFHAELENLNTHYAGRPSPLYFAERLTEHLGGAKIYFKRDELNHTGSHKINNCLGQILLARRMGKTRIIAETGAGQHGVAVATVAARFGLPCVVYMGATDIERQKPNVFRMRLLGAELRPVTAGNGTLKDAMNEALRDWVTNVESTYYLIGTAAGPHPYPEMVRDFQSVIGKEAREQIMEMEGRLPDALVACIGGGSNAIGLFHPFLDDRQVAIYGVEAGGHGLDVENGHAASMNGGRPGVLHGNRTYLLQDDDGQILEGHSISAGLDYPGVGPEHSWLRDTGRVTYVPATDREALDAFQLLTRIEGIIPALEPAHALAHVIKLAPTMGEGPDHRHESLRPRRQGRLRGGRASRHGHRLMLEVHVNFGSADEASRVARAGGREAARGLRQHPCGDPLLLPVGAGGAGRGGSAGGVQDVGGQGPRPHGFPCPLALLRHAWDHRAPADDGEPEVPRLDRPRDAPGAGKLRNICSRTTPPVRPRRRYDGRDRVRRPRGRTGSGARPRTMGRCGNSGPGAMPFPLKSRAGRQGFRRFGSREP